ARHFVRVGFVHHPLCDIGCLASEQRRRAPGKPRHCNIETAPEKVHRAYFADEPGTEVGKEAVDLHQDLPKSPHIFLVVNLPCRKSYSRFHWAWSRSARRYRDGAAFA